MRRACVPGMAACGLLVATAAVAQQPDLKKPKVDLVSVVGCVAHPDAKTWTLTRASDSVNTDTPYTSEKEIDDAKARALGAGEFRLIGTNEFVTTDELLKDPQRAVFTTKDTANTTGTLVPGAKVVVKGLLIPAPNEKRLNLMSVQRLGSTCP